MITYFERDKDLAYDGRQLAPHWIYRQFDLVGDAAVAFVGPCKVELDEMVDLADVRDNAPIFSPQMLHVIAEFFDRDLELAVYRQRMLIVTIKELLEEAQSARVQREGDDLYVENKGTRGKLTVSIATASPVSTLIHTGINVRTEGTPVPTVGLRELGVEAIEFAPQILERFSDEVEGIRIARSKVRAVLQ